MGKLETLIDDVYEKQKLRFAIFTIPRGEWTELHKKIKISFFEFEMGAFNSRLTFEDTVRNYVIFGVVQPSYYMEERSEFIPFGIRTTEYSSYDGKPSTLKELAEVVAKYPPNIYHSGYCVFEAMGIPTSVCEIKQPPHPHLQHAREVLTQPTDLEPHGRVTVVVKNEGSGVKVMAYCGGKVEVVRSLYKGKDSSISKDESYPMSVR